jgi:hypothetical protein
MDLKVKTDTTQLNKETVLAIWIFMFMLPDYNDDGHNQLQESNNC